MEIKGFLANNKKVSIKIEGDKIVEIKELGHEYVTKQYIIPGFIETHSHGGYGFDWIDSDLDKAKEFLYKIAKIEGTTSIVGTTITTDKEKVINAINTHKCLIDKKDERANLIGYHIEGPFINPLKKGAHPVEKMLLPKYDLIKSFLEDNYEHMKIITLAPELSTVEDIELLKKDDVVVFAGHTMAEYNDISIHEGNIDGITHFNNAMIKIGTDNDSLAKYGIKTDDLYIEFINDGIHNNLDLAKAIHDRKPKDKLILITDSLHIKGLRDGDYEGPNWTITKKNGAAWTPEGILNGSVYTQIAAFKDWVNIVGSTMEEAVKATSTNAAELLKLNKGKIEIGYDADILILDKNLYIQKTIVMGKEIK